MESDIDLRAYFRVVLKQYKLILLGTVLAGLAALVIKNVFIPP